MKILIITGKIAEKKVRNAVRKYDFIDIHVADISMKLLKKVSSKRIGCLAMLGILS
jgi:hypothetical protein